MKHITNRYPLPSCAIHGEEKSIRVTARMVGVSPAGMPRVVVDMGDLKGVPLAELHNFENFLTSVYDWRRLACTKGEIK